MEIPAAALCDRGEFQIADIDDSREATETPKEIKDREVWTVGRYGERHLEVIRLGGNWIGGERSNRDTRGEGLPFNHQNELIGLLVLRHDRLQSGKLLLQSVHFRLKFGSPLFVNTQAGHLIVQRLFLRLSGLQLRAGARDRRTRDIKADEDECDRSGNIQKPLKRPGPFTEARGHGYFLPSPMRALGWTQAAVAP